MHAIPLTAALLAATLAAPALAQGPGGLPAFDFDAVDSAGAGEVDRAALEAFGTERLAALDLDGDGLLDRDELAAALPARPSSGLNPFAPDRAAARVDRLLAMFGATEAGAIPVEAMVRRQVDMLFARLDRDGDGVISREEAEAPVSRRAGRGHGHRFR
jgi:Ca2+-binding EF-hand superfamily protein